MRSRRAKRANEKQENSGRVFPIFSFRQSETAAAAPLSENRCEKSDVRIIQGRLEKIKLPYISQPSGNFPNFGNTTPPPMWEGERG